MAAPRVLLLSAPFGSGHHHAALAVAEALRNQAPSVETQVVDVTGPLIRTAIGGYLRLVKSWPAAWRELYKLSGRQTVGPGFGEVAKATFKQPVQRLLTQWQPDAVVATHPFPGQVLGTLRQKGKYQGWAATVLTDFSPHRLWLHPGLDGYFVAHGAMVDGLRQLGVVQQEIQVTGIPVMAPFRHCRPPKPVGEPPLILAMGGGLGFGPLEEIVQKLAPLPLRLCVVAGLNKKLEERLRELSRWYQNLTVIGFTPEIWHYMAQADLIITKPGGLTCSEALALGVPLLLAAPLPGHEEANAQYLVSSGAARVLTKPAEAADTVTQLLAQPDGLARLAAAAQEAGRPDAAEVIAAEILKVVH